MLKSRIMPCLLIQDSRLVKTVKFKNPQYVGDPCNAIKIYNAKEVDELIILDIGANLSNNGPNYKLISELVGECFMPLCYGGGVNEITQIKKLFRLGVEKVSINSSARDNPNLIKEASSQFGSQSIVVSVDIQMNFLRKYKVFTENGRNNTGSDPFEYIKDMEKLGAGEILLNFIDRDGTWNGFDFNIIEKVANSINIPLIVCGGAGTNLHLSQALKKGASAVAAGSMFVYSGKGLGVLINFPSRKEQEEILEYDV